jgi:small subunit ribosomal protein S20
VANIKSAKKRVKIIAKKSMVNKMVKSSTKTAMKKVVVAINAGDKTAAQAALKPAIVAIDKAYSKGILHRNAAARKKSSLTKSVNAL